jgi:hypothetical protein
MTLVAGIDYSTHHVDVVFIDVDGADGPRWERRTLHGQDAFDRTRSVRTHMPARGSWTDAGVLAVGIEHPAGHHGVGALLRVQGAVLACLPPDMLVKPWPPSAWRKAVGLAGNATKRQVLEWAEQTTAAYLPEQDAVDAYAIAVATAAALHHDERKAA